MGMTVMVIVVSVVTAKIVRNLLAWVNRNRRPAKDFEAAIVSAIAFLYARLRHAAHRAARSFRLRLESDF